MPGNEEVCAVANDNAPGQVVHLRQQGRDRARHRYRQSKGHQARDDAERRAPIPLPVDGSPPPHEMEEALAQRNHRPPRVPVIANVTAKPVSDPDDHPRACWCNR